MNRYSEVKKISSSLKRLKKVNPNFSLDMHYILGFPTETDKDFLETMEFIKDINFDMGFIYRFSLKPGTKAESIEPKVKDKEIDLRINNAAKILKKHKYKVIPLSKNNFYTFYKK